MFFSLYLTSVSHSSNALQYSLLNKGQNRLQSLSGNCPCLNLNWPWTNICNLPLVQRYQLLPSLQQSSQGRQQPNATSALKPDCSSLPRGPGERWQSKTILPSALIQHTRARTSHTEIPLITADFFTLTNGYFCGRALWPELPAWGLSSTDPHSLA